MKNVTLMMSKIEVGGSTLLTSILIISILGIIFFLILNRNQRLKYLKKVTSIALILTMLLLPFPNLLNVRAEETIISVSDTKLLASDNNFEYVTNTAKLTVNDVNEKESFYAYKVLDVYYNESTNEIAYDFTAAFQTFLDQLSSDDEFKNLNISKYQELTSDIDIDSSGVTTESTLNKLVSKYATYLKKQATGTVERILLNHDQTDNTKVYSDNVEAGSYLILASADVTAIKDETFLDGEDGNPIKMYTLLSYGVMVANVVFTADNGKWALNDVEINAKYGYDSGSFGIVFNISDINNFMEDLVAYHLNSTDLIPSKGHYFAAFFDRTQTHDIQTNAHSSITSNSQIMNKVSQREFIFPQGLTYGKIYFVFEGQKVEALNIRDNAAYYTKDGVEKKFADVTSHLNEMDKSTSVFFTNIDYNETYIIFELNSNENTVIGSLGNQITTKVTILKDAYLDITGMEQAAAETAVLGTLSFDNTIFSYGAKIINKNSDGDQLTGAKFGIYTDKDCTNKVAEATDLNDISQYNGLDSKSTYYLKQLTAPTGYRLLKDVIELTPTNLDKNTGYYNIEVTNTKMGLLPSTGGLGTILYTLVGLLVIGVGSTMFIKYRQKQAQVN